jgi:putative Mg2+ transporter-C (MgtC) family protein
MTDAILLDTIIRIGLAAFLGMIIGVERILAHKTAGMRTYALVTMGAALFVVVSQLISVDFSHIPGFNPSQIAASIVSGVGFLGASLMIWRDQKLTGLTSASGLWVCAGIGMAVGYGYFELGIVATVFVLFIFIVLWFLEEWIKKLEIKHEE